MRLLVRRQSHCPLFTPEQRDQMRAFYKRSVNENSPIRIPLCGDFGSPGVGVECDKKVLTGFVHTRPHSNPVVNTGDMVKAIEDMEGIICMIGNRNAPYIARSEQPFPSRNLVVRCINLKERPMQYEEARRKILATKAQFEKELAEVTANLEAQGPEVQTFASVFNTHSWFDRLAAVTPYAKKLTHCGVSLEPPKPPPPPEPIQVLLEEFLK